MRSRVSCYVAAKRRAQGLSVEALAVRLGYRDLRKGIRRVLRVEHDGVCSDALLVNLAEALGLSYGTVLDLIERDATNNSQFNHRVNGKG